MAEITQEQLQDALAKMAGMLEEVQSGKRMGSMQLYLLASRSLAVSIPVTTDPRTLPENLQKRDVVIRRFLQFAEAYADERAG